MLHTFYMKNRNNMIPIIRAIRTIRRILLVDEKEGQRIQSTKRNESMRKRNANINIGLPLLTFILDDVFAFSI